MMNVPLQPAVVAPHAQAVQHAMSVPVVAPVTQPAPAPVAVQAAPAPAPAQPAAAPVVAPVATSGGDKLTRDKLSDMLLSIVEERTGYPRDMVGMDQNLEADLGIDSIKRIEVVGAILQQLPAAHRDALTESRSKLNTQPTLKGMIDLIAQAQVGGAVAVPFDQAGVGTQTVAVAGNGHPPRLNDGLPPRLVMRSRAEALISGTARGLTRGRFVVLRDGDGGVAEAIAAELRRRGVSDIEWIDAEQLLNEVTLAERCAELARVPIAGVLHLTALRAPPMADQGGVDAWRQALWLGEKSFFVVLRELSGVLIDGAHVLAATDLGGLFGRARHVGARAAPCGWRGWGAQVAC